MVDHVEPIAVNPARRLDPTNLRSLCKLCHSEVTTNWKLRGVNEPLGGYGVKKSRFLTSLTDPGSSKFPCQVSGAPGGQTSTSSHDARQHSPQGTSTATQGEAL